MVNKCSLKETPSLFDKNPSLSGCFTANKRCCFSFARGVPRYGQLIQEMNFKELGEMFQQASHWATGWL